MTGKGRAFCAGADIKSLYDYKTNYPDDYIEVND